CFSANVHHRVASAFGDAFLDIFVIDQTDTHGIDQRIAVIRIIELDFAANSRDADAVSVTGNSGNYFFKQIFHSWSGQLAETQRVQQRNRPCAHGEDVTD